MTGPPGQGPNEFYLNMVQSQLDRRFADMTKDLDRRFSEMDRRFNTIDMEIRDIKTKVDKIEDAPKDTFRAYATPILVSIITAILLAFLVRQGVVTK